MPRKSVKPTEPCLTMSVPAAGKLYFGVSPARSYALAQRGDIPTIRLGRALRVPRAAMDRLLADADIKSEAAAAK